MPEDEPLLRRSRRDSGLDGILLVDKDPDWTSHDVVAKLRGVSGQKKIGHTGTLDPAATGLLILCFGKATRLVQYMTTASKTYVGIIQLGIETDTDDSEGKETARGDLPDLTQDQLDRICSEFTGPIQQIPPAFSAVKVDGRRAYAIARKGDLPQLVAREVQVHRITLHEAGGNGRLRIEVDCGSGTYIRSLARDIGRALGCGAHLARSRRTSIDRFPVEAALPIGALQALGEAGRFGEAILPVDEGLDRMEAAIVTGKHAQDFADGRLISLEALPGETGTSRIFSTDGSFIGLGRVDAEGRLVPEKVFRNNEST